MKVVSDSSVKSVTSYSYSCMTCCDMKGGDSQSYVHLDQIPKHICQTTKWLHSGLDLDFGGAA